MAGLLTAFVAGNNRSAAVGTMVGSRTDSGRTGELIGILGFSLGLVSEGTFLSTASDSLMPHTGYLVFFAFLVSFIIFLVATMMRTPLSLTMTLVGTAAGISLRLSYAIPVTFLEELIFVWVAAPVLVIFSSYALSAGLRNMKIKDTWRAAAISKVLLITVSFFTAFTLGANTLGLILSLAGATLPVYALMLAGIFIGTIFIGKGTIKRVGEDLYSMRYSSALVSLLISSVSVEIATIFGIPLSNTQSLTSSVVGTGLSYRYKSIYMKPFLTVVVMWIVSPLLGFVLGYSI